MGISALGYYTEHYILVSGALFTLGCVGFLVRRNVLVQLMCIELMLNAVNLALVAFNRQWMSAGDVHQNGQMFAFFIIAVARGRQGEAAVKASGGKLKNAASDDPALVSPNEKHAPPVHPESHAHGVPVGGAE